MGNRCVITTKEKKIGVYLHWNGGSDSVRAFLAYCKIQGYRPPERDCYGWSSLCTTICNFFGGGISCGIDLYENLDRDNGDNGVYIIENWDIVGRLYAPSHEQDEYDLEGLVRYLNECQPEKIRIKEEVLEKKIKELENGKQKNIE